MEQTELVINGNTYPKNLKILKKGGINDDWEIKPVYFIELEHGLMGLFPAIIANEKRIVITISKGLLQKIWETLSPRRSKMVDTLFYVHKKDPVGYQAQHSFGDDYASVSKLLTEEEYNILIAEKEQPFMWAPGLVGNSVSAQEFKEIIESALVE